MKLILFYLLSIKVHATPIRVMTQNLWHGFGTAPSGRFASLESRAERQRRERAQAALLRDVRADVYLLQEFNGLPRRAERLARLLPADLQYQLDAVGFKVFGFGYPARLESGTVTLTRPDLGARPLGAVSLDQRIFNPISTYFSLQTREEHFALLSEFTVGAVHVLLANVHLHGDVEGDARRAAEVSVLLDELEARAGDFDVIIVGGDFNADPARRMTAAGYTDAWNRAGEPGYTYDLTTNAFARTVADRTLAPATDELVARERRPRRIDYVWVRDPRGLAAIERTDLVRSEVSDHYGVCVDLILK